MIRNSRCRRVFAALALACATPVPAGDTMLVLTDEEYEANLNYRERGVEIVGKRQDPEAPRIVVAEPDTGTDVVAPVYVAVRFEAAQNASIDINSLKVRYGWFDITKRVLESMDVTGDGISGQIGSMRNGKYAISISISDTLKRTSSARIEFRVVDIVAQDDGGARSR